MAVNLNESPTVAKGIGKVTLPPGMTQEEADRLLAEAKANAARNKENNS